MSNSQAKTRERTKIELIGHAQDEFRGTKLPTNREVLQCFYYQKEKSVENRVVQSDRESATTTIRNLVVLWERAGIPIRQEYHCISKLLKLSTDYKKMKLHSKDRKHSVAQALKQSAFEAKLDKLFDIAHSILAENLKDKDVADFLQDQRENRAKYLRVQDSTKQSETNGVVAVKVGSVQ